MQTITLSPSGFKELLSIELCPEQINRITVENHGNEVTAEVSVNWRYEAENIEISAFDSEGDVAELDAEQYREFCNQVDVALYKIEQEDISARKQQEYLYHMCL